MTDPTVPTPPHTWVDVSSGVSGDMLLGALLDAGADLERVRASIAAVVPGVEVDAREVKRAGFRALKVDVAAVGDGHAHRAWADIRSAIATAALPDRVKRDATAVFQRLAEAEATVHGSVVEDVQFHELGAWDSVADVVGVCAALHDLHIASLTFRSDRAWLRHRRLDTWPAAGSGASSARAGAWLGRIRRLGG